MRHCHFALAIFVLTSTSAIAQNAATCKADGATLKILSREEDQLTGTVLVNGVQALAIIDTGAEETSVDRSFSEKIGLKIGDQGSAFGYGRATDFWAGPSIALTIGRKTFKENRTTIFNIDELNRFIGEHIDIILGRSMLRGCQLIIDNDAHDVKFFLRNSKSHVGQNVDIDNFPENFGNGPFSRPTVPTVQMMLGGRDSIHVILDTGSSAGIDLIAPDIDRLIEPGHQVTSSISMSMTGVMPMNYLVLPYGRLQGTTIRDAEVYFVKGTFPLSTHASGLVGMQVLHQFNLDIDISGGAMWLSPRKSPPSPLIKSTSGLLFKRDSDSWTVEYVMLKSPAATNGWKQGDKVCAVDGEKISPQFNSSSKAKWTADHPGLSVNLTMCDGAKRQLTGDYFY